MTAQCFADTSLLLYAASKDPADARKKAVARALLESKDIGNRPEPFRQRLRPSLLSADPFQRFPISRFCLEPSALSATSAVQIRSIVRMI